MSSTNLSYLNHPANVKPVMTFGAYKNAEEIQSLKLGKIPQAIDILFGEYEFEHGDDPIKWKMRIVNKCPDITAYIQNKIKIIDALRQRWIDWKSKNSTELGRIQDCDQKLNQCESLLTLMTEVLEKDNSL